MPEASQYFFTHKELLDLLVKAAGVKEGRWTIAANIGFTAGNFGPSIDQMAPGAAVVVLQMGIQKAAPETPGSLVVDATSLVESPAKNKGKKII